LAIRYLITPMRRFLERSHFDLSVASFLVNSTRSILIVVVILGVLQQIGVQTASLLTLLGAVALAVTLSLQNSLSNFASGLIVLTYRMVRVGDFIEIGDVRGQVHELLPFHIVVVGLDNQRITLPNTVLTTSAVRNNSALPTRQVQWLLPLTPQDDLAAVKESLQAHLQSDERILTEPRPALFVQEWTEDKRVLAIQAWTTTADYLAVQRQMLERL